MKKQWWHGLSAYQIYPKSFYDTNGDGIGDLPGIIEKLDYLKDLGVDILWLSPVYVSPLADQGYDIADYRNIDPRFGTMEDMDRLLQEAHKRNMYILMDLVVNHCSDEHEWFREACANPEGKYGKYFYIETVKPGEPLPTNWRSYFGGSVWEKLPGHEDKYYLHVFHKKQPDLNWENPELREEVYSMVNWWLDKGLDGFRLDAILNIKKGPFRNYPADRPDGLCSLKNMLSDAEGVGDFLTELKERTFLPHHSFTVGEVMADDAPGLAPFIGEDGYFCSIFDFSADSFGKKPEGWIVKPDITPEDYKHCIFGAQSDAASVGFLSNIIENHDEARGASRYIPKGDQSTTSKTCLAAAYFFLRGIPWIYQGQEIGMENYPLQDPSEIDDVIAIDEYHAALKAGWSPEDALRLVEKYSRDNARTPFQWDASSHAGFTSGTPWFPENPNYKDINLKAEQADPNSVFHFYKKLIRLRKDPSYQEAFVYGEFLPYLPEQKNLIAYYRKGEEKTLLILCNFQKESQEVTLPGAVAAVALSNLPETELTADRLLLKGYQAVVLELVHRIISA